MRGQEQMADEAILVGSVAMASSDEQIATISAQGCQYLAALPDDDHIGNVMAEGKPYEEDLLLALARLIRPGDLIVDCGANIGNHTLYFATVCQAQVEAYEPNPAAYRFLRRSIELNGLEHVVHLHETALSDRVGRGSIKQGPSEKNLGMTQVLEGSGDVLVSRLDDASLGQIALLKVDVEGAEAAVVRGSLGVLRSWRPAVVVETQSRAEREELDGLLRPLGYRRFPIAFGWTDTHVYLARTSQKLALWSSASVRQRILKPRWLTTRVGRLLGAS
jgi:FkbM family methyltransferase